MSVRARPEAAPANVCPNRDKLLTQLREVKRRLDRGEFSAVVEAERLLEEVSPHNAEPTPN